MALIERYLKILEILSVKKEASIAELSAQIGIGHQTIGTSVAFLNETYGEILTITREKQILSMKILDIVTFEQLLYRQMKYEADFNSKGKRLAYLFQALIDSKEYLNIDELAFELCISRGTLLKDLKELRGIAGKLHAKIEGKTSKGIRIVAPEYVKRILLVKYVIMYFPYEEEFALTNVLEKLSQEFHLDLETEILFRANWVVSMNRMRQGFVIEELPKYYQNFFASKPCMQEIAADYELRYQENLPKVEFDFLFFPINLKNVAQKEMINPPNKASREMLAKILKEVFEEFSIAADLNRIIEDVACHLLFLFNRLSLQFESRDLFFDSIYQKYPLSYKLSQSFSYKLGEELGREIPIVEVGYLAIYFELALRNIRKKRRKQVALIGELGVGLEKLAVERIQTLFGQDVVIVKRDTFLEVSHSDCLLAFSTRPMQTGKCLFPIYPIATLFEHSKHTSNALKVMQTDKIDASDIHLRFVKLDEGKSYSENLDAICCKMTVQGVLDEEFRTRLLHRERQRSMVQNKVAFPHTINDAKEKIVLIIALPSENYEISILFLLGIPRKMEESSQLVDLYDNIFQLIHEVKKPSSLSEIGDFLFENSWSYKDKKVERLLD